mmetsp:Transcript_77070/g.121709  ORF Transcript_77070/g.121709 Transcript_77070/m.121709 type:complete len:96 (+) Transcript_77070:123-410(+)|eukprot:CAMPEP_0169155106 /NCGR_PEP_ID=MMETSP1015-20121227/53137_1 /TAXON_ID=342587 /ORGANISM="Karlodinium micrum, Strain CCMP2283" /LENGTH=95 /DNA_ID=CAMNT_0009225479 /DNA_START=121 /DNA_END=408 /DNA_ORIENTATION=-
MAMQSDAFGCHAFAESSVQADWTRSCHLRAALVALFLLIVVGVIMLWDPGGCPTPSLKSVDPDSLAAGTEALQVAVIFSLATAAGKIAHNGLSMI